MRTTFISVLVLVLFATTNGQPAFATVTTFTDRATWNKAVGSVLVVDFNEVTEDTSFVGTPIDMGPFVLLATPTKDEFGLIDAVPFFEEIDFVIDGTPYARCRVDLNLKVHGEIEMTFDTKVTAWGADFSKIDSNGLDLVLTSDVGTTTVSVLDIPETGFFGFVTSPTELISSITFVCRSDAGGFAESFGMDNVALYSGVPPKNVIRVKNAVQETNSSRIDFWG